MPVFHRPRTVIVSDDGGSPLAAVAALVGLVVIISAASAIVADVLNAILIILGALCAGGIGVLAVLLRRTGLGMAMQRPAASGRASVTAAAPEPVAARSALLSIEVHPAPPSLPGVGGERSPAGLYPWAPETPADRREFSHSPDSDTNVP